MRIAVDELYDEALKWESLPRGKNAAISHLQKAINDIRKVVDEPWLKKGSTLKFDFTIPKIFTGINIGWVIGEHVSKSLNIPGLEYVGVVVGAAVPCIKLEKKLGTTPLGNLPERSRIFAALYYVEKEFPGTL